MTRRQAPRCCGKVRFATQEAAEAALHRIQNLAEGRHPVRVYRCPRGWFHMTSQPHSSERKEPA